MKKNIIFLGKNGQISNAFFEITKSLGNKNNDFNYHFYSSSEINLSDPHATNLFLYSLPKNIDLIVNCMAYNNVNKAQEEQDLCNKINNISVDVIAKYCSSKNIKLVHFSTDYVFDGASNESFNEDNTTNLQPQNFYGKTKLLGEQAIQKSGCDYIIIRLSWVYDHRETSQNFVNTIKKLAQTKEVINIVKDQIGSPTSANFVARNCMRIFDEIFKENKKNIKEIIHLNNGNFISLFDYSLIIFEFLRRSLEVIKLKKINPIKTTDFKNSETDFAITKTAFYSKTKNSKLNNFNLNFSNNLQNRYATIFAHYDKNQIINDCVIFYLENLRKISDYIIFVSDCNLSKSQIIKIQNLCQIIVTKKHGEYDFGSYKIGIELFLDDMRNCNNLILANDSCFGPIKPFENIFQLMEFSNADFWGLTTNQDGYLPHLQSYFLVFKEKILLSDEFAIFFRNIAKQINKKDIIEKYEVGLTQFLLRNNFKMDSFIKKVFENNPTISKKKANKLIKYKFPLIKFSLIEKNLIYGITKAIKYKKFKILYKYLIRK